MSRKEARGRVPPRALAEAMRAGSCTPSNCFGSAEKAPSAYPDIREVLDDQTDLVERRVRLEPIAVLKG